MVNLTLNCYGVLHNVKLIFIAILIRFQILRYRARIQKLFGEKDPISIFIFISRMIKYIITMLHLH